MYPRVKSVIPLLDYKLSLVFEDGMEKVFDVRPYLNKGIFKELKKKEVFNSVCVVDGTVQWSNEADFCPDTLYQNGK